MKLLPSSSVHPQREDLRRCDGLPVGRSICAVTTYLIACVMPFLLLLLLGYVPAHRWNQSAIRTNATVISHDFYQNKCMYLCKASTGQPCLILFCDRCYHDCYDGSVSIAYDGYIAHVEVISGRDVSYGTVKWLMNSDYPLNHVMPAYYNPQDPQDVEFKTGRNDTGYLIASICVISIGSVLFIVWLSAEAWVYFKRVKAASQGPVNCKC